MKDLREYFSKGSKGRQIAIIIFLLIIVSFTSVLLTYQYLEVWSAEPEPEPEPEPVPAIGFIDLSRLQQESEVVEQYQAELDQRGEELENMYNSAGEGEGQESFEQEQIYHQYLFSQEEFSRQLFRLIEEAIDEAIEEYELWLVVDADSVITGGVDITDQVISYLDENHSTGEEDEQDDDS